jgi:exonuclease V gamma subunit
MQNPETRQDPSLQPLFHYLVGAPDDLKAIQLGHRPVQHFERMLLQRPNWILSWDRG